MPVMDYMTTERKRRLTRLGVPDLRLQHVLTSNWWGNNREEYEICCLFFILPPMKGHRKFEIRWLFVQLHRHKMIASLLACQRRARSFSLTRGSSSRAPSPLRARHRGVGTVNN